MFQGLNEYNPRENPAASLPLRVVRTLSIRGHRRVVNPLNLRECRAKVRSSRMTEKLGIASPANKKPPQIEKLKIVLSFCVFLLKPYSTTYFKTSERVNGFPIK